MLATDLSKQKALDASNTTNQFYWRSRSIMFFSFEEAKEIILDFHKEL